VPSAAHPFLRKLGNRIRRLRERKGLSQEAFADLARLDRSYMSGIERGVRNFSVLNLAKIAKALGVPITLLFEAE
jgi:transcriptional regulator with XRE-family HTH domain